MIITVVTIITTLIIVNSIKVSPVVSTGFGSDLKMPKKSQPQAADTGHLNGTVTEAPPKIGRPKKVRTVNHNDELYKKLKDFMESNPDYQEMMRQALLDKNLKTVVAIFQLDPNNRELHESLVYESKFAEGIEVIANNTFKGHLGETRVVENLTETPGKPSRQTKSKGWREANKRLISDVDEARSKAGLDGAPNLMALCFTDKMLAETRGSVVSCYVAALMHLDWMLGESTNTEWAEEFDHPEVKDRRLHLENRLKEKIKEIR